jgi:hypothetical protein
MRAEPGAELVCTGRNYNLPPGNNAQPRGVLSYYATEALPQSHSMADWLARIESHIQEDIEAGHLPPFYRPQLQILGDSSHSILSLPMA